MNLSIRTHRVGKMYYTPHFFILCKGENAGKPMTTPCPNCFVAEFENEVEKDHAYWVCFGLWQGKIFHRSLVGSVIPFLRVKETKDILINAIARHDCQSPEFRRTIFKLRQINALEENILRQASLLKQAKISIGRLLYKTN
ncbi:MAG: hypothetical protein HOP08_00595 [Cyclobacteriaceae bacterium]|nr:hypothetical protein [Cyclobacteriaceae bacterium]